MNRLTPLVVLSAFALFASMLLLLACQAEEKPSPGSLGLGDPLYPGLGNGGYEVSHYTITLDVDVDGNFISGNAEIEANATQALLCAAWRSSRRASPAGPPPTAAAGTN
ncbi:MAG: hypothetical protein J4F40_18865 [Alphaproteobacteria bacterium]|nr:hypothetical protein [Alphaproteobacteria bacterium]